jgi:hypothetical protein
VECAQLFCDGCVQVHKRVKATREHRIQALDDFEAHGALAHAERARPVYCGTHTAHTELHELTLYCRTCDTLICMACTVNSHPRPGHDFTFAADVAAEQRAEISALAATVHNRGLAIKAAATAANAMRRRVAVRAHEARSAVHEAFEIARDALVLHEGDAARRIDTLAAQKDKELTMQHETLGLMAVSVESAVEFVQTTLEHGSDSEVLASKAVLVRRLEALERQQLTLVPTATDSIRTEVMVDVLDLALEQFCTVHDTSPDPGPGKCAASGPGLGSNGHSVKAGTPQRFSILLRDKEGYPITEQCTDLTNKVAVTVQADGVYLDHHLTAVDPSILCCEYTPQTPVVHAIHVAVLGTPIPDSPFLVAVGSHWPTFVGWASWDQDAKQQGADGQDRAMDAAAATVFPGSRAATGLEHAEKLIAGMPKVNLSGNYLIFHSPGNEGECAPNLKGKNPNSSLLDDSPATWFTGFFSGKRTTMCVRD